MQPRTDLRQRCLNFQLDISAHAEILTAGDCAQNVIHYFDIPRRHSELLLRARSLVMVQEAAPIPEAPGGSEWEALAEVAAAGLHWDWLVPSHFARPTSLLAEFGEETGFSQIQDPLEAILQLNGRIHNAFEYTPKSTAVDSPIDAALQHRRGVCQDFTHVMIALLRQRGIPARYISGYIFQDPEQKKEEDLSSASHAWVEAFLPSTGWIGLDPTNNSHVDDKHIRIAVGRDYADVPPTRGIYKGNVKSELSVGVHIAQTEDEIVPTDLLDNGHWTPRELVEEESGDRRRRDQQQQQQQ